MKYDELVQSLANAIVDAHRTTEGKHRQYVAVHVGRAQTTDDRWTLYVKSDAPQTGGEASYFVSIANYVSVHLTGNDTEAKILAALLIARHTDDAGDINPFAFDVTTGVLTC